MRTTHYTSIVITALLGAAASGEAKPPVVTAAVENARPPSKAEKPPAIDHDAIAALRRMGAFLREQQSFTVRTTTETDYVLDSGQKIRLGSTGEIRVRRPDKVRAEVVSDRRQRQFFYDGATFTVFSPRLGYYATVPAPSTILATADMLQDRYGLELPMVDLFRWGSQESDVDDLTAAMYVGATKVNGVDTDQYAFRQPGLDWQIWIQRGEAPVPRKLLLTTTDDPARPERSVEMTWELGARHADSEFTFVPPKDSQKIVLTDLSTPRGAAARRARRTPR